MSEKKIINGKSYFTVSDTAGVFDVSLSTVRYWIYTKKVEAFKFMGKLLIPQDEVDRLLSQLTQKGGRHD